MIKKQAKRERTKFERWMFEHRVTWRGLSVASDVSRTTLWELGRGVEASAEVSQKILDGLRKMGHEVSGKDLW